MTGPELRRLHDELQTWSPGEGGTDLLGPVPDDEDGLLRLERLHGPEHVIDHRPARNRVQHLGLGGLHPRPLPGRKNHDK